jgi:hypothetical protein
MANYDFPVFVYPHSCTQGPCDYGTGNSITGGFVYRGTDYPQMQGYYICADYGSENIWLIEHDGTNTEITMQSGGSMFSQLTTFGEDEDGELYAASLPGVLYRVVQEGALPVYLTYFEAINLKSTVDLKWSMENVADVVLLTVERSLDGVHFHPLGTVTPQPEKKNYLYTDLAPVAAVNYYRIVYSLQEGSAQISSVRTVDRRYGDISTSVYTHASGGMAVRLAGDIGGAEITLYTTNGQLVSSFYISETNTEVPGTAALRSGVYVATISSDVRTWTHKWFKG